MKDHLVLRVVTKFMVPFILLFGFYIQFHGDYSPGGGFQAGVILASAFILHALIFGTELSLRVFPMWLMKVLASVGVLLYGGTGFAAMFMGGEFLNYSVLAEHGPSGQHLGIFLVELGVGTTVFSVMLLLFFTFSNYDMESH